ncbi:SGNH/GDSL hydrolase family protein [Cohnella cellulosilytica]|uniref:SGNH/GDSL hydrolase family protein n=1 Tax=Cohnella cellulosilytica TaxID=986710 RepID=A0ABW2F9P2_9BACL
MNLTDWKQRPEIARRIVAFGSSNTALSAENEGRLSWVEWLLVQAREHLGSHVSVINQGVGGETTDHLLDRIGRDVEPLSPSLVIVTIGGNDTVTEMPLERYKTNLRRICSSIRSLGAEPVLQTYYCPDYEDSGIAGIRPRFEGTMDAVRETADELKTVLVDQYLHFEPLYRIDPADYRKLMRDWLHLNAYGNLAMARYLLNSLGLPPATPPGNMEPEASRLLRRLEAAAESHPFRTS